MEQAKAAAAAAPGIAAGFSQRAARQATTASAKAAEHAAQATREAVAQVDPQKRMRQARNWTIFILFGGLFAYSAGSQIPHVLKDVYIAERKSQSLSGEQQTVERAPKAGWTSWAKGKLGL